MTTDIKDVAVLGLGVMGFDIAFLYAQNGYRTLVSDLSKDVMDALDTRKERTIERLKKRKRISDSETERVRRQLLPASDLTAMKKVDLITEAVSENAGIKSSVYKTLSSMGYRGIMTTNTSSLTRGILLGSGAYDRANFVTTHFFNPVLYTRMVEVVKGDMQREAFKKTLSFLTSLGRQPVQTRDISGFVSNSILMVYAVMALRLIENGARIEQVDQTAKRLGLLPPFISFDNWKPSIVEDVTRVMHEIRGDEFLRSSKLLAALSRQNPKFYRDEKPNEEIYGLVNGQSGNCPDTIVESALKISILTAAARTVELGESPTIVDAIAAKGIKLPFAPLREIDARGASTVIGELAALAQQLPSVALSPPRLLTELAQSRETFYKTSLPNPWLSFQIMR
jgi:3-hydroxyacyl-CoA dehydrogenase